MTKSEKLERGSVLARARHAIKARSKGGWNPQEIEFAQEILRMRRLADQLPHKGIFGNSLPDDGFIKIKHNKKNCGESGGRCLFEDGR